MIDQKRTEWYSLRLSPVEKKQIAYEAAKVKESVSEFIRKAVQQRIDG